MAPVSNGEGTGPSGAASSEEAPFELLGLDQQVARTETVVTTAAGSRRTLALAGLVVLFIVGWLLARPPSTSENTEQDEAASSVDGGSDAGTTSSTARESSPTSNSVSAAESAILFEGLPGDEEIGHRLLVAHPEGSVLIDLDSGQREAFTLPGHIELATDNWLVVRTGWGQSPNYNTPLYLPLDNLDAEPEVLVEVTRDELGIIYQEPSVTMAEKPDHVWVVTQGDDGLHRSRLMDLATGDLVFEGPSWQGGEIVGTLDGRIFDYDDGDYELLIEGHRLLGYGERYLLTDSCPGGPGTCELTWLDRSDGERVDRSVPPRQANPWFGGAALSDRIIGVPPYPPVGEGRVQIWDVDQGAFRDEVSIAIEQFWAGFSTVTLTGDDRFMAFVKGSQVQLLDLDTSTTHTVYELPGASQASLILTPTN